jgi:hypothetical protein
VLYLIVNNTDTVKAVHIRVASEPVHPHPRRFHYFPSLPARDRLKWTAEGHTPPRFHLDEGDECPAPSDNVDLDATDTKTMRNDFPTTRLQKADCLLLGVQAALVARIGPTRWITMNAVRHGDKLPPIAPLP